MRVLSFAFLSAFLIATDASAQNAQLAPIPMPLPFPQGSLSFSGTMSASDRKGADSLALDLSAFL